MASGIDAMAASSRKEWPVGKGPAFYAFIVVFLAGLFDFLDRQVLASLFPFLKAEWGLTDTQLGSLVAVVNISISILVVPTGILVDRWSRSKMLGIMTFVWSLATGLCAFAGNFAHLFAARCFLGAGESGYAPASQSLLPAVFPARLRTVAVSLACIGGSCGGPLGLILGAYIATHWGWRHAFGVVAIPGFIVAIMAFWIKDYKSVALTETRDDDAACAEKKLPLYTAIGVMLKTPTLLLVYVATTSCMVFNGIVMNWMPSYFIRVAGWEATRAASVSALILFMGIISFLLVGPVTDFFRKKNANATTLELVTMVGLSAALMMVAFHKLTPGSTMQVVCLVCGQVSLMVISPLASTTIIDVVHPGVRATAVALLILLQNVCGMGLGPLLVGLVSDRSDLGTAIATLAFTLVLGAAVFLLTNFTYRRDRERNAQVKLEFC